MTDNDEVIDKEAISLEKATTFFELSLQNYLKEKREYISSSDLEIVITNLEVHRETITCEAELKGNLNEASISLKAKSLTATTEQQAINGSGGGGCLVTLLLLLGMAVYRVLFSRASLAPDAEQDNLLFRCFDDIFSQFSCKMNKSINAPMTGSDHLWYQLKKHTRNVTIIYAVIVFLSCMLTGALTIERNEQWIPLTLGSLFLAPFCSVATYFTCYLGSLLILPSSFYENEAEGKRAMSTAGVSSVFALKFLAGLLFLIMLSASIVPFYVLFFI